MGTALGLVIGVAIDNIGLGLGIGVALGSAGSAVAISLVRRTTSR